MQYAVDALLKQALRGMPWQENRAVLSSAGSAAAEHQAPARSPGGAGPRLLPEAGGEICSASGLTALADAGSLLTFGSSSTGSPRRASGSSSRQTCLLRRRRVPLQPCAARF